MFASAGDDRTVRMYVQMRFFYKLIKIVGPNLQWLRDKAFNVRVSLCISDGFCQCVMLPSSPNCYQFLSQVCQSFQIAKAIERCKEMV